jgi:hypothetical protein
MPVDIRESTSGRSRWTKKDTAKDEGNEYKVGNEIFGTGRTYTVDMNTTSSNPPQKPKPKPK